MAPNRIIVSAKVMEGMEAVRRSGRTNMLAVADVIQLARKMGFAEAAVWISENRLLYTWGALLGFHVDTDPKEESDEK